MQLWNAAEDPAAGLVNTRCYVASNGTVVWTRPGTLKASIPMHTAAPPPACTHLKASISMHTVGRALRLGICA